MQLIKSLLVGGSTVGILPVLKEGTAPPHLILTRLQRDSSQQLDIEWQSLPISGTSTLKRELWNPPETRGIASYICCG